MRTIYLLFLIAWMGLISCENEKNTFSDRPSIYLGGDAEQSATTDSVIFSFKTGSDAVTQYNINLKVHLAGTAVNRERTFDLEVVGTASNAPTAAYSLGSFTLPANAYVATVPITVHRTVSGIDLTKETAYITLRVKENNEFVIGADEFSEYKISWCDYLLKPYWWGGSMNYYCGPFSQARYKFILDYYGDVDLVEEGIVDSSGNATDYAVFYAFVAELIELLNEYNATHATPYMNDDGVTPLRFGSSLTY